MTFILDTDVLSALRRPDRNRMAQAWLAQQSPTDVYLSVLTLGEIRRGVEKRLRVDPAAAAVIDAWLSQIKLFYRNRILPIDDAVSEMWGRITVTNPHNLSDALIAATALVRGFSVVTRNVAHFADRGVAIINPFEQAP